MRISEGKFVPGHPFKTVRLEDAIYDAESGFQVRISLKMLGSDVPMSVRDGIEHIVVGFVAHALALISDVKEGLGTGVDLFFELGNHYGPSG